MARVFYDQRMIPVRKLRRSVKQLPVLFMCGIGVFLERLRGHVVNTVRGTCPVFYGPKDLNRCSCTASASENQGKRISNLRTK